jgi:sn-glycerol 3-phosphate transport system ATP-binding protein
LASIKLKNVTKSFGNNVVLDGMDLDIKDGSFTVLVGPSGCGKTTLLRMIAGIGPQTSGEVYIGDSNVSDVAPGERGVAMVFQNYAIYPTMSIRENIEFGLKNNKVPRETREKLVSTVSKTVGLTEYLDRRPGTLSGGQRQRVALARAMVKNPQVFLMDEPLSNLDAMLRVQMRVELIELHNNLKTTFVYVTHDQVEAMSMADTIILMNKGKIMQKGSPYEIYHDPDNLFTARFMGSPSMNIVECPEGHKMGFRPEHAHLSTSKTEEFLSVKGRIVTKELLGSETIFGLRDAKQDLYRIKEESDYTANTNDEVYFNVPLNHLYFFDSKGSRVRNHDADYKKCVEMVGEMIEEGK